MNTQIVKAPLQAKTAAPKAAVPVAKKAVAKVVGVTAALSLALNGMPAVAADLALGEDVFTGNCAACHTGGNNILVAEKTLKKDALEKYLEGGYNVSAIVYQVTNGKGQMPAWNNSLEEEEIQAVAEYVYATAAADAW